MENLTEENISNAELVQKYITTSNLSPNPTTGKVKLQVNAAKDYAGKIDLLDINGKVIQEIPYKFSKGYNEVLLSLINLSNGTYIAAVYNSNNFLIGVHKIVKQ